MNTTRVTRRLRLIASTSFLSGVLSALAFVYLAGLVPRSNDILLRNVTDEQLAEKLKGEWLFDDLRTSETERDKVLFDGSGNYEDQMNESVFEIRWFTDEELLYFVSRRVEGAQDGGKDHVSRVVPQFDAAGDAFTIAFEGNQPHGRLIRTSKS